MKNTVLNQTGISNLQKRIEKLQPLSKGLWGQMHVQEMIRHCNAVNHLILIGQQGAGKTSLKQHLAKIILLYLPFRFPKNVKAPKIIQQSKASHSEESFTHEKALFLQMILQFPTHHFPLKMYHPAFGNLSSKQWGIAAWKHIDHHLRQFGV